MDHTTPAFETYHVLGVPISVTTLDPASDAVARWSGDMRGRYVCVRDVHGIMQAQDNPEFKALHEEAAMVTPDGMPLVWLGRRAGLPVERTAGADLMEHVFARQDGLRHYLYGGRDDVARELESRLKRRFPKMVTVAAETPPYHGLSDEELKQLADRIISTGADVVWIGLSTPKQEYLMRRLAPHVPATLIGVGAAFDFHSGMVKRAPLWMQRSGLEWLHRFASQPRRLWKRYLVMAPRFVWLVAKGQ